MDSRIRVSSTSFIYLPINPIRMVEVFINQQKFQLPENGLLADVLPLLFIQQADGIAIAVNQVVVPRGEWERFVLQPGDTIFVIKATQGG
jgi:sulfur carrier protein